MPTRNGAQATPRALLQDGLRIGEQADAGDRSFSNCAFQKQVARMHATGGLTRPRNHRERFRDRSTQIRLTVADQGIVDMGKRGRLAFSVPWNAVAA